jgi:CHAT domain-containing protein
MIYANPLATVTRAAGDAGMESFGRLKYSREEAEQISKLFPETEYDKFLDFDASRAVLAARDLSKYRILHFATHSFIDEKNPELSGIVLSLYDKERHPRVPTNSIISSSELIWSSSRPARQP